MSQDPSRTETPVRSGPVPPVGWSGPEPYRVPGKKKRSAPRVKRETLALLAEMERLTAENAGGVEDNEEETNVNLDVLRLDETQSREGGASISNACTGGEQHGANWAIREGGASAPNACTGGEQYGANWAIREGDLKMDAGMESGGFFGGLGGPMDGALEDEPSFDAPLPPDFDIAPYPAASSSSS
jgi:hypothetical protein